MKTKNQPKEKRNGRSKRQCITVEVEREALDWIEMEADQRGISLEQRLVDILMSRVGLTHTYTKGAK